MTPDLAQRLAGKILFLNTTLFGHIGQPALQPLYGRAYGTSSSTEVDSRLSHGLRSALRALRLWLNAPHPRIIPFSTSAPTAVVYADAYFELGDQSYRIGTSDIPQRWRPMTAPTLVNGWGLVTRVGAESFYSFGRVPPKVLQKFCHRKAYIYMLELTAQLAALAILQHNLPPMVVSFCDNRAGLSALQKGFGKDEHVNRIITLAWRLIHHKRWFVHFEWVASDNNVSDKISRHNITIAAELGLQPIELDMSHFYEVLIRASDDDNYTYGAALHDLCQCGSLQLLSAGTGNVAVGRPDADGK